MCTFCNMSTYDFNPELCLQVLQGIAEEIPSGVSGGDLKAICPKFKFTQELLSYVRNTITSITKKDINRLWIRYQIAEKLKHLEELEEKSPKHEAWRPTTGRVDLNPIIAKNLLSRKMELMKQIELVREESAMITPYLRKFSEKYKHQLEEIQCIEREENCSCVDVFAK